MEGIDITKNPSVADVKVLLSLNFRIAVYLKALQAPGKETPGVGELIEYHFVRDKQNDGNAQFSGLEMQVNCVLCKSRIGDSLKLCGLKRPFSELKVLFELPRLTGNHVLYFERTGVSVYPFDWYACFETPDPGFRRNFEKTGSKDARASKDPRWQEIATTIQMLPKLSADFASLEEIHKKQKRDKEDTEKRAKEEEERKKREEENKKREESRRKMEELVKSLEVVARADDNPDNFAKFMETAMAKKKK